MIIYEEIFKKYGLSKTQQEIIKIVGENKIVLEIGSSTGYMTKVFLDNGCHVDVVEKNSQVLRKLPKGIRKVFNISIEDEKIKLLLSKDYDFIIMADVLEHLADPQKSLKILHKIANKNTKLIISLPNIASWVMRKQLFFKGDFEYQDSGILDRTHLHFYTVSTLPKLLSENGWSVERLIGTIIRLPLEGIIAKTPVAGMIFKKFLYQKIVQAHKNLAYYHFLVVVVKQLR